MGKQHFANAVHNKTSYNLANRFITRLNSSIACLYSTQPLRDATLLCLNVTMPFPYGTMLIYSLASRYMATQHQDSALLNSTATILHCAIPLLDGTLLCFTVNPPIITSPVQDFSEQRLHHAELHLALPEQCVTKVNDTGTLHRVTVPLLLCSILCHDDTGPGGALPKL